jgi:hypothetical protein
MKKYNLYRLILATLLMAPLAISCTQAKPADTSKSPQPVQIQASCQIGAYSLQELVVLKENGFENLDAQAVNALAVDMVSCMDDPDPEVRDGLVFEGLSTLLRAGKIDNETKRLLFNTLSDELYGDNSEQGALTPDQHGFRGPFAALNLAELARADRVEAYLSEQERDDLVDGVAHYLQGVIDYRGFDDVEGWRHGVAHAADLVMQLSLNENISYDQLCTLRSAIASQIMAANGHAYIYGEPARLARPILFMARRGEFTEQEWSEWFTEISNPAPLASWGDAYSSEANLAKRHNTKAFLDAIYLGAAETKNDNVRLLKKGVIAALQRVG